MTAVSHLMYCFRIQGWAMSSQSSRSPSDQHASESVIPFAPQAKDNSTKIDELDLTGRSILSLLSEAAGAAEETTRYALEQAQKLSQQLQAAKKNGAGARERRSPLCRSS